MDLEMNVSRLERDLSRPGAELYEAYWKKRTNHLIPPELLTARPNVFVEIGAGTGWFLLELARDQADTTFIGIERDRFRGNRLMYRAGKAGLPNFAGFRGNAIPAFINGIPSESVDRIYLLYPAPHMKTSQRKHRWYIHPIMPHIVRILKKGGKLVWASDQKFYIDEAHFVCSRKYQMPILSYGQLAANEYNDLARFPSGRTKFEVDFLKRGIPCYELIARKSAQDPKI